MARARGKLGAPESAADAPDLAILLAAVAGDRRSRHLRLTAQGEKVRATALAASEQLERELQAEVGPGALAGMRHGLLALVSKTGDLNDVLARRARIIW